jgi:hypothetical protein
MIKPRRETEVHAPIFWDEPAACIFGGMLMKIGKVAQVLNAELHCGEESLDSQVYTACGADLMSDVLAFVKDQPVLLTGLINPQVIRTADMMDIKCVVFVRGKKPEPQIIELAKSRGIVLMSTNCGMYLACGKLYASGLEG